VQCPRCQVENRQEAQFCSECGHKFEISCPECGNTIRANSKFCDSCGCRLETLLKTFDTDSETESPPHQPATDIEANDVARIDGERKHVTVVFSDLTGYTAMSEKLDPEDVKDITSRIFGEVSKIVATYDGFIEKYAGDAVMAIFGVPHSHEDDPIRAIKAGREIHQLVDAISPDVEKRIGQSISMHTGINSGLVVTGEVDIARGTHGVAGDTINLASRLSGIAKAGEILVGPDTHLQAEGYFNFEALGKTLIKGKTEPVDVHKVLSPRERPSKTHRILGLRAELIGRTLEMSQLGRAVEKLRKGGRSIISVCGDAGTGKSRLVEEFRANLDFKEIQWQEGHSNAYSQTVPYFPIIDLLNRSFQIKEQDPPEQIRKKIELGIEDLVPEKRDIIPYIGGLYSLSFPEADEASPEFWQSHLYSAVQKIFSSIANRAPTVICLEDLHWADPSSLKLLHFLLSEFTYPAVFLCIYRPTFTYFKTYPPKNFEKIHREIQLHDLSSSETQDMIGSLLKTDRIPAELQKYLGEKAEGNPFYLEEVINSLIESEALVKYYANWKLSLSISDIDIPPTIHGVIGGRLDRLEMETKRILQEASVIGREFLYNILKQISDLNYHIDRCLSDLVGLDLIKTKSIQPELEYIFKHGLTQETAYKGLLKKERREIHKRIGIVIEQLFQDRLPEFYETLAYHFSKSQSELKAVDYLIKSGDKSLKRYALEESDQYFRRAYDILSNRPEKTKEEFGILMDIINKWASVFYFIGDVSGFMKLLKAHEKDVERVDDKSRQGMYYAWFGWAKGMQEQVKDSFYYLEKALKIGEDIDDQLVVGYACTWLIYSCMECLIGKGVNYGEKAFEIAKDIKSDQYLYFKSLGGMGHIYYLQGKRKRTSEIAKSLLEYGKRHSNVRCMTVGHICSGYEHALAGDFSSAIRCYQEAITVSKDPIYRHWAGVFLGTAYLSNGQLKEAEAPLHEVVLYSQKYGYGILGTMAYAAYGIVIIEKGQMSQGLKILEDAKRSSLKNERVWVYAFVEYLLGSVYAEMARGGKSINLLTMAKNIGFLIKNVPIAGKKAEDHFSNTIRVAKEIGANGLLGPAYLDLGLFYKAKKRTTQAKECITRAIDVFTQSEADVYLKHAREALASLQ
jgi:class 3 adenylate cyclase/tetratricopeptide (TPR) repeat protein